MFSIKHLAGVVAISLVATHAHAQANLTAEAAAPVSVGGNTVLGLAELAAGAGVANIQVATGQTLTNAVQNVAEGKTDIGAAPFTLPFLLSRGVGPYAKLGKEGGAELASKLAVLYTYRVAVFGISSYESTNFGGYSAIEGAKIYNGPPRGGALNRARSMVKLATGLDEGKGYTGVQVNWGQAVKTITDGSADAFLLPMNFPDGRQAPAAAAGKMVVHSFPKDVFESANAQKYAKAPGTAAMKVEITPEMFGPNFSVISEDNMFRGYADVGGDLVNVSMDEELAYQLTKAFLEGLDTVKARTPFMPTVWLGETAIDVTGLCGPMPMKYHPGAVRAWEEAGYTLPDCAKP
ncbi:MAG: TAXI family TRAP transporter solute-binding subunit [Sedimentitalea sp.]